MPRSKLTEGMRAGDLADLVLPLISVDEYVSKVDPKTAMVIGLYVHEQEAADDLNRFIQKSAIPLLDTEVSPAPDQHGYYLVFVELLNDDKLPTAIGDLLAEIAPLVSVEEWRMRVRDVDGLSDFTPEALKKAIDGKDAVTEQAIMQFFGPSDLRGASFKNGTLTLETHSSTYEFNVVRFLGDDELAALAAHELGSVNSTLRESLSGSRLARGLGEGWSVDKTDRYTILHSLRAERTLLLSST